MTKKNKTPKKKVPKTNQDERQRFIDAARELDCDEDESKFDYALREVAKTPHDPKPKSE